jgi:hypothetical protein
MNTNFFLRISILVLVYFKLAAVGFAMDADSKVEFSPKLLPSKALKEAMEQETDLEFHFDEKRGKYYYISDAMMSDEDDEENRDAKTPPHEEVPTFHPTIIGQLRVLLSVISTLQHKVSSSVNKVCITSERSNSLNLAPEDALRQSFSTFSIHERPNFDAQDFDIVKWLKGRLSIVIGEEEDIYEALHRALEHSSTEPIRIVCEGSVMCEFPPVTCNKATGWFGGKCGNTINFSKEHPYRVEETREVPVGHHSCLCHEVRDLCLIVETAMYKHRTLQTSHQKLLKLFSTFQDHLSAISLEFGRYIEYLEDKFKAKDLPQKGPEFLEYLKQKRAGISNDRKVRDLTDIDNRAQAVVAEYQATTVNLLSAIDKKDEQLFATNALLTLFAKKLSSPESLSSSGDSTQLTGVSLNLSCSNVTDQLVAALVGIPNLTSLDLSNNLIGPIGAELLAQCTHLRQLNLSGNPIGVRGVEILRIAFEKSECKLLLDYNSETMIHSPSLNDRHEREDSKGRSNSHHSSEDEDDSK